MNMWYLNLAWFALGAYFYDVIYRPDKIAKRAKIAAKSRQKPLLNVGAGTASSSLRALIFGPTLWGDINLDIAAGKQVPHSNESVSFGDIHQLPFKDKEFGAVIASHVLEHVKDPVIALNELSRVADEVFIITPLWWCPHTWLHPGHRWYVAQDGICHPLWGNKSEPVQLPIRMVEADT